MVLNDNELSGGIGCLWCQCMWLGIFVVYVCRILQNQICWSWLRCTAKPRRRRSPYLFASLLHIHCTANAWPKNTLFIQTLLLFTFITLIWEEHFPIGTCCDYIIIILIFIELEQLVLKLCFRLIHLPLENKTWSL